MKRYSRTAYFELSIGRGVHVFICDVCAAVMELIAVREGEPAHLFRSAVEAAVRAMISKQRIHNDYRRRIKVETHDAEPATSKRPIG